MKRKRLLVVVGLMCVVGLAAGCKDQPVRDYLGESGQMYAWEVKVQKAICQLEVNNPTGLDPALQICPGGPIGITPPPSYPPK